MRTVRQIVGGALLRTARSLGSTDSEAARASAPIDLDRETWVLWDKVKSRTMTSVERIDALRRAVEHLHINSIAGDIVECGVWRGGSVIATALTLKRLGAVRQLWLYDTFDGMTPPCAEDVDIYGRAAADLLAAENPHKSPNWARSSLADVQQGLADTGYPTELAKFVIGPVEETIPETAPEAIALLRLDTDWVQSTYHELTHLWPRVVDGGILIIDDYGHWAGAKKAVDQYFSEVGRKPFLNRIDYTGRLIIK